MFEEYLQSIKGMKPKYQQFSTDVAKYIQGIISEDRPLYAVHGFCTDGGVSGSMIRYSIGGKAAIVPIDYWMLNDNIAGPIFADIEWTGIVDLKPFNRHPVGFWVDHHVSAMGERVNAERIRYDHNGDSGAYQLLLSEFLGPLPEHLVELAVMTRTTDTAAYVTEPPTKQFDTLDEVAQDVRYDTSSREKEEQRIWLLDDAWGSTVTFKQHLDLYNLLAKDGFIGLEKVLSRINQLRSGREQARIIADEIELDTDIIVFSFDEDTQDKFTILRRLQKNGAKVAVSFSVSETGVKISLRRNRYLSDEDTDKIQLQKIAELLNGGGHPGAAGGFAPDIDSGFETINDWANRIGMSAKLVEL